MVANVTPTPTSGDTGTGGTSATTQVSVTNFPSTQQVAGTVAVSNFPASQQVSNFPAKQAVSLSPADYIASQTIPPVTGSLAALNDAVAMVAMGAPGYEVLITPTPGSPLVGTVQFYDPVSGSNRSLFKAGVGELDVGSVPMLGQTTPTWYRGVSFNGFACRLTNYVSGSATVTIWGSYATSGTFQNNPVHSTEEGALRNGRAFTAASSTIAIPTGQNLSFVLSNPAGNNLRLILLNRTFTTDQTAASTAAPCKWFGISNPTVNLPATVATVTNRRTGGAVSASSALYGVSASRPDTSPTLATPGGGFIPTGGNTFQLGTLVTIEPGTSRGAWINNVTGATLNGSINFMWIEEVLN